MNSPEQAKALASGQALEIGDKVRMNIPVIAEGDMDGIEFTSSGKNYWGYMKRHPDEVYTVVDFDFTNEEEVSYILSGEMAGNNWYSEELILVPPAKSNFETIKNMTKEEMAQQLLHMILAVCEDGIPSPEVFMDWLESSAE